ncbi:Uncharacterised protein [Mycobacterium tuberculosis]|nr:Uncharacterised protein [Mycobacterium tuberculosis]
MRELAGHVLHDLHLLDAGCFIFRNHLLQYVELPLYLAQRAPGFLQLLLIYRDPLLTFLKHAQYLVGCLLNTVHQWIDLEQVLFSFICQILDPMRDIRKSATVLACAIGFNRSIQSK